MDHDEGPEVHHEEILRWRSRGEQPVGHLQVQEQHRELRRLLYLGHVNHLHLQAGEQFHQQLQAGIKLGGKTPTGRE